MPWDDLDRGAKKGKNYGMPYFGVKGEFARARLSQERRGQKVCGRFGGVEQLLEGKSIFFCSGPVS